MPIITSFVGEKLLAPATVAEIKNQTEILLKNKDVAGAFQSAAYLKAELAKLPAEKVAPVLDAYRAVTANLKVLALPLLEKEELKNLLANNLAFVGNAYADILPASLAAWLALQPEAEASKIKEELLAVLPADNPLSEKIKRSAPEIAMPFGSRDQSHPKAISAAVPAIQQSGNIGSGKDELFDDDEASELAEHAAKVSELGGSPLPVDGAVNLGEGILKLAGSVQDGEIFKKRAQALVVSRLRDVRATAEIRDYLGRPFAVGGLGLSGDGLEKALKLIEQEYQRLHASGPSKAVAQESPPAASPAPKAGVKSQPAAGPQSQDIKSQDEGRVASSVVSVVSEAAASFPVFPTPTPSPPKKADEGEGRNLGSTVSGDPSPAARDDNGKLVDNGNQKTSAVENIKAGASLPPAPLPSRPIPRIMRTGADSTNDKPRLDDIRRPSADIVNPDVEPSRWDRSLAAKRQDNIGSGDRKGQGTEGTGDRLQSRGNIGSGTVGATDELKLLTLADWRKLGGGPAAISHILEKVSILAKESLSEKLTAIESFRESELFREYLDIGRGALSAGRKLAEALADAAVNSNKMTEEEFFAIAELNGKLK